MAVLALAAAGAALAPAGIAFAGISYASIGWTLGAVVGQLLFPGSLPAQVGPRLGDLRVQQSQYGAAIPILYGTTRVAGNVIWSSGLLETVNTQEVGGKGSPSQTQTTYSYRVSMAVLLGRGPVLGIRKIWASGKLIYNVAADADIATVAASNTLAPGIAFYNGSETQLPDPTIEAYKGVGNVSGHRGLAYLVLSDFQLADYNNIPPNITVEVVAQGSLADDVIFSPAVPTAVYRGIATDGTIFCALGRSGPGGVSRSADGVTWSPFIEFLPAVTNMECIDYGGGLWVVGTGGNIVYTSTDSITWTSRTIPMTGLAFIKHNGSMWVGGASGTNQFVYSYDGITWTLGTLPVSAAWQDIAWNGSIWLIIASNGTTAYSADGVSWTAGAIGFGTAWSRVDSNGVRFVAVKNGSAGAGYSSDGLSWTATTLTASQYLGLAWTGDFWLAVGNANTAARSLDNGATWIVTTLGGPLGNSTSGLAAANGLTVAAASVGSPGSHAIFRFDVITPDAVPLSSVLTDLCLQAGLSAGDIDVSGISRLVRGYAVAQTMTVRAAIETLQRAFHFDAIESDNKIKFVHRGGAPVVTLTEEDLGATTAGDSPADTLPMVRQQEPELPSTVSVLYLDVDADYQQNMQQAKRNTVQSTQTTAIELAVVMTGDEARAIAETLLYDAWTQRQRYTLQTTREHAAVEPGDVVQIVRGGTTYTVRIQKKVESRSGVIQWDVVAEEASVYTQAATGAAGSEVDGEVRVPPATILVPLDIAVLRDEDNDLAFYAAACGTAPGWRGAVVYRSTDSGASYDQSVALTAEATIGYTGNAFANFTGSRNVFDQTTLLTVVLFSGELSSATEQAVCNGANYLAVGFEIVQFKSAVLIGANTYQLSGFIRGQRGTEWAISSHTTAGERVVLLNEATLRRIPSDLTTARLYKPVSIGKTIQETTAQSIQYFGGNLAPFAPVSLSGGRDASNNMTISWFRRSRHGINLPWNYDPPLGEASQLFDVEIWNTAFSTLRRTFSSVATLTQTYTAAQQAADSGGVQAAYGIRVYQRSAITGRGYVLQRIL